MWLINRSFESIKSNKVSKVANQWVWWLVWVCKPTYIPRERKRVSDESGIIDSIRDENDSFLFLSLPIGFDSVWKPNRSNLFDHHSLLHSSKSMKNERKKERKREEIFFNSNTLKFTSQVYSKLWFPNPTKFSWVSFFQIFSSSLSSLFYFQYFLLSFSFSNTFFLFQNIFPFISIVKKFSRFPKKSILRETIFQTNVPNWFHLTVKQKSWKLFFMINYQSENISLNFSLSPSISPLTLFSFIYSQKRKIDTERERERKKERDLLKNCSFFETDFFGWKYWMKELIEFNRCSSVIQFSFT